MQLLIRPHCLHVYISIHMFWWLIFCLWVQLWEVGNPLWPSDAIWQQRSGTTLAQVMAYCLPVPWNNLNQCWHIVQEYNFTGNITRYLFWYPSVNWQPHLRPNELKTQRLGMADSNKCIDEIDGSVQDCSDSVSSYHHIIVIILLIMLYAE